MYAAATGLHGTEPGRTWGEARAQAAQGDARGRSRRPPRPPAPQSAPAQESVFWSLRPSAGRVSLQVSVKGTSGAQCHPGDSCHSQQLQGAEPPSPPKQSRRPRASQSSARRVPPGVSLPVRLSVISRHPTASPARRGPLSAQRHPAFGHREANSAEGKPSAAGGARGRPRGVKTFWGAENTEAGALGFEECESL